MSFPPAYFTDGEPTYSRHSGQFPLLHKSPREGGYLVAVVGRTAAVQAGQEAL